MICDPTIAYVLMAMPVVGVLGAELIWRLAWV